MEDGIEEDDDAEEEEEHGIEDPELEDNNTDKPRDTEGDTIRHKDNLSQKPCKAPDPTLKNPPSKFPPKKITCTHIRCKIADSLGLKTGLMNPNSKVQRCTLCTSSEKDNIMLKELENSTQPQTGLQGYSQEGTERKDNLGFLSKLRNL